MSELSTFATLLRELRVASGASLELLAERAGVSQRTISDIERGVSATPQRRTVEAIADGLSLSGAQRVSFVQMARERRRLSDTGERSPAVAPHRVYDFTGRSGEIAEIRAHLEGKDAAGSLIVISGAPGFGKTTIALEALNHVRETWPTALFVDLDGFSAAPLTPVQVLRALLRQVPELAIKVPSTLDAATELWQKISAELPIVALLDNAADESQVAPVLNADGAVVVTSRRTLSALTGAHRILLEPLAESEGSLLLARLIPEAQRDDADLLELSRLCDNIPLALRIVGARIASRPTWTTASFLARMRSAENRLRMLVAGDRALEAAISLSYDDLDPGTATLFRGLSVIGGGTFDARIAAAALGVDVSEVMVRLSDLTELGLLEARGETRYRLHDLLRIYGDVRLRDELSADEMCARRDGLRHWLLTSLSAAGSLFEPTRAQLPTADGAAVFADQTAATAWIRVESGHWWPALREAAARGEHAIVVDVCESLHWFSDVWMHWAQWHELFALAVASARATGDEAMESTHLGYLAWSEITERVDYEAAMVSAERALSIAERLDDDLRRGWAHFYMGWAAFKLHDIATSTTAASDSIQEFRRAGDADAEAGSVLLLAAVGNSQGNHSESIRVVRDYLDLVGLDPVAANRLQTKINRFTAYQTITDSYLALAQATMAIESATAALRIAEGLDDKTRVGAILAKRVQAYILAGQLQAADSDIRTAFDLVVQGEDPYSIFQRQRLEALRAQLSP